MLKKNQPHNILKSFTANKELRLSCDFILESRVCGLQTFDPRGKETGNSKVAFLKTVRVALFLSHWSQDFYKHKLGLSPAFGACKYPRKL